MTKVVLETKGGIVTVDKSGVVVKLVGYYDNDTFEMDGALLDFVVASVKLIGELDDKNKN